MKLLCNDKKRRRVWTPHGASIPRKRALNLTRRKSGNIRFETKSEARARARADAKRLGEEAPSVRALVQSCRETSPCDRACCAFCARAYRRWLFGELLTLVGGQNVRVVTIVMEQVTTRDLPRYDLDVFKRRLRARIDRAGVSLAIGGIDAEYRQSADAFDIHAHLVVEPSGKTQIEALRKACEENGPRALKSQGLRDPNRQLSYLFKLMTVHRPRGPKTRAFPLPRAAHLALMMWRANYGVKQFIFLFGARIKSGHIVRR